MNLQCGASAPLSFGALPRIWQVARGELDLTRPQVMGIVNVTPDSFSDGGLYSDTAAAIRHCERLVKEGADLLDIGGESTRPGAAALDAEAQCRRVMPVLKAALSLGVLVSVDTSDSDVMRRALAMGTDIVNDVRALRSSAALALLASHPSAGVCLMHMRGEPAQMQSLADYRDVTGGALEEMKRSLQRAQEAGIAASRIVLDPGIGFAKLPQHNLILLAEQQRLLALGRPLLVGWSRKSVLGQITGKPVQDRQAASVAAALLAVQRGASIVRVHDVAATVDALKVLQSLDEVLQGLD